MGQIKLRISEEKLREIFQEFKDDEIYERIPVIERIEQAIFSLIVEG